MPDTVITITVPAGAAVAVNGTPVVAAPPPAPPVVPAPPPPPPPPAPPVSTPVSGPEVLQVGPGQPYTSLTAAFQRAVAVWAAKGSVHVIVDPGPPGYYNDDTGFHSPRWTHDQASAWWPPFDGYLGACVVEGTPGKARPDLVMTLNNGNGDAFYYGKGWFMLTGSDVTLRRLRIAGCHRADGQGNYAALRIEDGAGKGAFLLDDMVIEACDDGILGGAPGQTLTITNSAITGCGIGAPGYTHNLYVGGMDKVTAIGLTSTNATLGHHFKARSKAVALTACVFGDGNGTESYCLDVPNGGATTIANCAFTKSPGADNPAMIHFGGADLSGLPSFGGSMNVAGLKLTAPTVFTRHPEWNGTARGLFNDGNLAVAATGVTVSGLTVAASGFPNSTLA